MRGWDGELGCVQEMKNTGRRDAEWGKPVTDPQIGVCGGKKAPLKRGLRPKGGGGFSLRVKIPAFEEKKPSVAAYAAPPPFSREATSYAHFIGHAASPAKRHSKPWPYPQFLK